MKLDIANKVVLITGGSNGIGRELVFEASKRKAKVIFCDIDKEGAKEVIVYTKKQNNEAFFYCCDVSKFREVEKMFILIKEKYHQVDILVNNAAIETVNEWFKMQPSEFSDVIDTNLKGVYYCMNYFSKIMNNPSNIINILSIYYNKPRLNKFHYDAAKSGVAQLTKEAALALGYKGIRVNALYPGYVSTNLNADVDVAKTLERNILKDPKISNANNFAVAVFDFIENFSLLTTGQLLGLDGGRGLN